MSYLWFVPRRVYQPGEMRQLLDINGQPWVYDDDAGLIPRPGGRDCNPPWSPRHLSASLRAFQPTGR